MYDRAVNGTRLRYRLKRRTGRVAQIGCILAIVALLGTLSFFILRYVRQHPEEQDLWVMTVVGGGFGLVAVILFFLGAVQQTLALRTPETIVEMDAEALYLGRTVTFFVQQPGSGSYESLRANIIGEEQQRHRKTWTSRQFASINIFDSGPFEGGSAPFEGGVMFDVPRDLEPTRTEPHRRIVWHLEVWGKVRGRADFQHVYAVDVLPPRSKTLDDDHV